MRLISSRQFYSRPRLHCATSSLRNGWTALVLVASLGFLCSPTPTRADEGRLPGYVVVPLTPMGRANQACIAVSINGRSTRLILDTGAYATVLDDHFYQGVHAQPSGVSEDQLPSELRKKVTANGEKAQVG